MSEGSTIRITREPGYRDMVRSYRVKIDGVRVGTIGPSQVVDFDVAPGKHIVRLTIDWTGSPDVAVNVKSGECVTLTSRARRPISALFQLFSRTRYIDLAVGGPEQPLLSN